MTVEQIREIYSFYRDIQKQNIKLEETLLNVSNEEDWVKALSMKSTFLRTSFTEIESKLVQSVYPFINGSDVIEDDIVEEFRVQSKKMSDELENDGLLVTDVLKKLAEHYKGVDLSNEVLANFCIGLSYADRVNSKSNEQAHIYLKKVLKFKDCYEQFENKWAKGNLIYAFFNMLANYEIKKDSDWQKVIGIYEEMLEFCQRESVRESIRERINIEEFILDCESTVKSCITASELIPPSEVLEYVASNFYLLGITEDNFLEQSSFDALTYVWYQYHTGQFDCNKALQFLFAYYTEKDINIDYSDKKFYDDDQYQVQMVFLKECFRYLAFPECTLETKDEIRAKLVEDFVRLYESIPYLENNAFLNMDLIDIMQQVLRSSKDEEEAFMFIKGVAIQRNAMTLIHSTMLAQIATAILSCLINNAPSMFFEVLDVDTIEAVNENKEFLLDYMEKAAFIHDIGKIVISDVINLQTRKITEDEYELIKYHPVFGADLIRNTLLEEKYTPLILGHHKFYDGTGGYPEGYDNTKVKQRILVDILTISDCIDAATDILGRNYATGKSWIPVVRDELIRDAGKRYNKEIVNVLCNDVMTTTEIQYLTSLGRVKVYYNIYQAFLSEETKK